MWVFKLKSHCQEWDISLSVAAREAQFFSQNNTALGYPLELDSKILLLKILYTLIVRHREIKLEVRWLLPWLSVYPVSKDASQAAGGIVMSDLI